MESVELEVVKRNDTGKLISARMRKEGLLPAVIYSKGQEAKHITVSAHSFRQAAHGRAATTIFKFKSDAADLNGVRALVRHVQFEPIKSSIHHVDFLEVHEGHRVHVTVPVTLEGEIESVRQGLAVTQQMIYQVEIECFPEAIPETIIAPIGHLRPGQSLKAGDLTMPTGVRLSTPGNAAIMSVFAKNKAAAEEIESAAKPAAAAAAPAKAAPAKK